MRALTPQEIDTLAGTLKPAVDQEKFDRLLRLSTGDRLADYVGDSVGLTKAVRSVLNTLNEERVTDQFLKVVYREYPFHDDLRALIGGLVPDIGTLAARQEPVFTRQASGIIEPDSEGAGLQKVVKPGLLTLDLGTWMGRLNAIARQVCAVQAGGLPLGTGFLVGDGAVLTNGHVADLAISRGQAGSIVCCFDYLRGADGVLKPTETVPVAEIAAKRPSSAAELTASPDMPPPQADELDYALLRLSRPASGRGHIRLAAGPPLLPGAPLYIVQHPGDRPMQIAQDTDAVIGWMHGGLRLRYHTNTEPGSSGSPCFSGELDLVALHHLGDPARTPPTYNQGIPAGLIRTSIVNAGCGNLLGP
jgi:hypothetical protein